MMQLRLSRRSCLILLEGEYRRLLYLNFSGIPTKCGCLESEISHLAFHWMSESCKDRNSFSYVPCFKSLNMTCE